MGKKILHLLLICILLFGNSLFCFSETAPMEHHVHMVHHREVSDTDCCPTQHPASKHQRIESILQKEVTKKKSTILSVFYFGRAKIAHYHIPPTKVYRVEHRDKQHFFFVDTIRLIV